ncbi:MAG: nucleoside triphosphate pyrophosphohydrolase [Oscillospiraceae bacterium]|jgi:tetrapyrrole methylase family protein/MazG family protein|nr:nucleoside triphosphate pyrophosphohydrolase [Oscillospiraceae bacterium]
MIDNFVFKGNYNFNDLVYIMGLLRSDDGCPWDKEQTHNSIKKNFIEETYEVIEAINKEDSDLLKEELGDVLLQVVFHSQMESENNIFNIDDVCDGICKKLIERHPHVFGSTSVDNSKEVLSNWDKIKNVSKNHTKVSQRLTSIPKELPALMRSSKIQQRVAQIGFDWDNVGGALSKLDEEVEELKSAIAKNDLDNAFEELGDVLFASVNVSRFLECDAEEALSQSSNKFIARFTLLEDLADQRGINLGEASLESMDKLWEEAKKIILESR